MKRRWQYGIVFALLALESALANAAPPSNDACINAIPITPATSSFAASISTSEASMEAGEPVATCANDAATVWYTYTNTSTTPVDVTIDTCDSNFDTAVMVWRETLTACSFANLTGGTCSDDTSGCGNGTQSRVSFTADPSATYDVQVGGFKGATGTLAITVTSTPAPQTCGEGAAQVSPHECSLWHEDAGL